MALRYYFYDLKIFGDIGIVLWLWLIKYPVYRTYGRWLVLLDFIFGMCFMNLLINYLPVCSIYKILDIPCMSVYKL